MTVANLLSKSDTEQTDGGKYKVFSQLTEEGKLRTAKKWLDESVSADTNWQSQAKEDFAFKSGHQWKAEEKRVLEQEEGRPALTFPLCKAPVDLIVGVNESNRIEVKAEPTEPSDEFLSDILNDLKDKMYDLGNVEDEEDEAFEDAVSVGRGFVAIDIKPDPKRPGEIRIPVLNVPIDEIRLDPAGRKDDLSDHRYIFWDKWVTVEDFIINYPDFAKDLPDILTGRTIEDSLGEQSATSGGDVWDTMDRDSDTNDYETPLDFNFYDRSSGRIRVAHMEYWDVFERYYTQDPGSGQVAEFPKEKISLAKKIDPNFQYATIKDRRVNWFQFIGDKVLYDGQAPQGLDDGFSIVGCFAYKDKSKKHQEHYGVIRLLKDPQREVNKRWSQTLNLIMKQGQGGYFAEIDAPLDKNQWQHSINSPGETTWVNKNAIGQTKFKEKEIPVFPAAVMQMEEAAQDIMKKISGINPDLLGIAGERQEPGIVVRMRQQQGLLILSRLFKSQKRMKRQLAEKIFGLIMAYMPDSQIKRILGQSERYLFRGPIVVDKENGLIAPLRNLRDLKYDITIEESPSNMTKMMAQLAIFMDMLSKGFPVDPETLIGKLDLPASEKTKWVKYVQNQQQQQSQMAMTQIQGKLQGDQAKTQIQAQQVASDHDIALKQLAQSDVADRRDAAIELAKLDHDKVKTVLDMIAKLKAASQPKQTTQGAK